MPESVDSFSPQALTPAKWFPLELPSTKTTYFALKSLWQKALTDTTTANSAPSGHSPS
jgi:hypothetical protein